MPRKDWQVFFDAHAPQYMQNVFTKNTEAEIAFLLDELKLPIGSAILDIGCGAGRHSVELARRGYRMTGVDLSQGMLDEARKAADAIGVKLDLIHCDATTFTSDRQFDAAICLCEGAFCLMGLDEDTDEHDRLILRHVHAALKPGAPYIGTVLSASRMIRLHTPQDIAAGKFDLMTLTELSEMETEGPRGLVKVTVRERGYLPPELRNLFGQCGFEVRHLYGGTAGNWGRRPLDPDEYEIMIIARRE
jgi:cyclopropane fatty-acyl-phospholipid synthase-like methyltransferase